MLKKIKKFFVDEVEFSKKLDKSLETFKKEFKEIRGLFEELFLEVEDLTAEETYTYLHSCVSSKNQKVIVPEVPMYIANYLCDCDLVGGLKPTLGENTLDVFPYKVFLILQSLVCLMN